MKTACSGIPLTIDKIPASSGSRTHAGQRSTNVLITFTVFLQSYLKKAFEAEKAEIKKEIADKEAEIRKYTEKFDALREKIDKKMETYKEEHNKLMAAGRELKDVSQSVRT